MKIMSTEIYNIEECKTLSDLDKYLDHIFKDQRTKDIAIMNLGKALKSQQKYEFVSHPASSKTDLVRWCHENFD